MKKLRGARERKTDDNNNNQRRGVLLDAADRRRRRCINPSKTNPWFHLPRLQVEPWLVFYNEDGEGSQIFYSVSKNRCYVKNIKILHDIQISLSSECGWLGLSSMYSSDCCLWNPVTMDVIRLPPLNSFEDRLWILTSPPNEDYTGSPTILLLDENSNQVDICRIGDTEWTIRVIDSIQNIQSAVFFEGKTYAIVNMPDGERALGVFHIGINLELSFHPLIDLILTQLPKSLIPESGHLINLVQCGNEMFMVHLVFLGEENKVVTSVEVRKVDLLNKKFEIVETLGDRAFFLDYAYSLSCQVSEAGIKGNCVYFTLRNATLHVFDLEEKSISISLMHPGLNPKWSRRHWVLADKNRIPTQRFKKFSEFRIKDRRFKIC